MPNVSKVAGFSPVKHLLGVGNWNAIGQIYNIASSDTNIFAPGDVVTLTGTGDGNGIPGITRATAGAGFVGVWMGGGSFAKGGSYVDPSNLDTQIIPATKTKAYYGLVIDDPYVIFEAQENGTALAAVDIGLNLNFSAADPATGTRVSGFTLLNSSKNTTATLDFKLLRLAPRVDNAIGSAGKWWVLPNNHLFRSGIAGL